MKSNKCLKLLKLKKIWHQNSKFIFIFSLCIFCGLVGFYFSYSKYSAKQETEVVRTTVGDFISGDVVLAYSIDGVKGSDAFPKQNTGYEGVSVTCDNEATAEWDNTIWSIKMTNSGNGKRVKCNVEFKSQETKNISGITFKLNTYSPDFSKSACSNCESKESGVFATEDDYGTSYYYRGSVDNNYVDFAGKTWRIIRINGDGSVRIILNDVISTSNFNEKTNDNASVGYMYGTADSSTYAETHKNVNDSTIKKLIDTWYENNINKNYASYLADSGFCGDRSTLQDINSTGYGKVITYYKGYARVAAGIPDLKCSLSNDLYTTSSASIGNKALKYPIATITADEVMLAGSSGGVFDGGYNYTKDSYNYLNINETYWTMTPCGAYVHYGVGILNVLNLSVGDTGHLDDNYVSSYYHARPVVNLKSNAIKSGNGEVNTPYKVA